MRRRALWQPSPNLNPDLVTVTMIILILTIMMQIRQKDIIANICQIPSILDLSQYNLFPPGVPAGVSCSPELSETVLLCVVVMRSAVVTIYITTVPCHVPVPLCHTNTNIMILRSLISSTLLILVNSGMFHEHYDFIISFQCIIE